MLDGRRCLPVVPIRSMWLSSSSPRGFFLCLALIFTFQLAVSASAPPPSWHQTVCGHESLSSIPELGCESPSPESVQVPPVLKTVLEFWGDLHASERHAGPQSRLLHSLRFSASTGLEDARFLLGFKPLTSFQRPSVAVEVRGMCCISLCFMNSLHVGPS